ncbi:MAG: hypothetical protein CVV21_09355 [Candidatus Goldiibacteriota bacterium HGW-Goldbacteria-1]|jgi:hypothetical protein|nr:MAG: hypothetical protein CVV21_09355 [Candidatus Goldiibacteriota bacterium HGW-Goldbacteria-1]
MKKTTLKVIMLFILPVSSFATSAGVTSLFDIGLGVRTQSMGCAFIGGESDSSSIKANPAALFTLERLEIQAAYTPMYFDTAYNYISAALPTTDFGAFGVSAAMMSTDDVILRDNDGAEAGKTSQLLAEFTAAYSNKLYFEGLLGGISFKVDHHGIAEYSDTSFGLDAGLQYSIKPDEKSTLTAGLLFRNLVEPSINLDGNADIYPRQVLLGAGYSRKFKNISFSLFADGSVPVGTEFEFMTGAEMGILETFFIRGGYNSFGIISFGAGFAVMENYMVDYGFFMNDIEGQHRVSVKVRLGDNIQDLRAKKEEIEMKKVEAKAKVMAAKELEAMKKSLDTIKKDSAKQEYFKASHYTRGLEAYYENDYKRSVLEFEMVYRMDSNYLNTAYYLSMVKTILRKSKEDMYSEAVLKLYKSGVDKYMNEDFLGAKKEWEKILAIDPYNKLALDNLKEVNSMLLGIEKIEQ